MSIYSLRPHAVSAAVKAPLLVVVPVYNEEVNIENVVGEWMRALDRIDVASQILLLNDGSKDHTLERIERVQGMWPDRILAVDKLNAGHGATCRLAYEIAAGSECEWVLQIDSDGQCDAAFFPDFWMSHERYDLVMGIRVQRSDGFLRMLTSKGCRLFSSLAMGQNVPDPNVPYRLMRRTVLRECIKMIPSNFNLYNVALSCVLYHQNNIRISRVPIVFRERAGGESSFDLPRVVYWGLAMIFELMQMKRSLSRQHP